MKFVLEQNDIKQVKDICSDYYGVELTNEQTKSLIEGSSAIRQELMDNAIYDTVAREKVSDQLVKMLMKDEERPINRDTWGDKSWHWPFGGSTDEYTEEFKLKFKLTCAKKNIKLRDNWGEGW